MKKYTGRTSDGRAYIQLDTGAKLYGDVAEQMAEYEEMRESINKCPIISNRSEMYHIIGLLRSLKSPEIADYNAAIELGASAIENQLIAEQIGYVYCKVGTVIKKLNQRKNRKISVDQCIKLIKEECL